MSKEIDRTIDDIEHGRDPLNHKRTHFDDITETPEKLADFIKDGAMDDFPWCESTDGKPCDSKCKQCLLYWLNQPLPEPPKEE